MDEKNFCIEILINIENKIKLEEFNIQRDIENLKENFRIFFGLNIRMGRQLAISRDKELVERRLIEIIDSLLSNLQDENHRMDNNDYQQILYIEQLYKNLL